MLEGLTRNFYSKDPLESLTAKWITEKKLSISEDITKSGKGQTMLQHCECTLAMAMRSLVPANTPVVIGVSKASCWPCTTFLKESSKLDSEVLVSYTHGKTYPGWRFPGAEADEHIYKRMVYLAKRRLEEFHDKLTQSLFRGL